MSVCLNFRYGSNPNSEYNFMSSAFAPFVTVCTLQIKGKLWLQRNFAEIVPLYEKFRQANLADEEKFTTFHQLIENIKLEKSKIELVYTKINEESASDELSADLLDLDDYKSEKETKPDNKSITKIGKQRRAKALKSKITKIRNEELTLRLNKNKNEILTQKCVSDSSIAYKKPSENSNVQSTVSDTEMESQESCNDSAWQQIWHIDDDSRPVIKEFRQTLNVLCNQILTIKNDDMFNIDLEPMIFEAVEMPDDEESLLYSSWNENELNLDFDSEDSSTPKNSKSEPNFSSKDVNKSQEQSSKEGIDEMMNEHINYVSDLLTKILKAYQKNWENDKQKKYQVEYVEG